MFSHILVPLDSTVLSKTALVTAAAISSVHRAQLTLLYVTDTEEQRQSIEQFIGNAAAFVSEQGARPELCTVRGVAIGKAIRRLADELHADLIVMDSRQRGAAGFYGNVAVMMVHEAERPLHRSLVSWLW